MVADGYPAINMANAGDQVLLLDGTDTIVDMISWGNTTFAFNPAMPTSADGQGSSGSCRGWTRIRPQIGKSATRRAWDRAVPEPASLVAAGLTIGLVAGLRTRRRAADWPQRK